MSLRRLSILNRFHTTTMTSRRRMWWINTFSTLISPDTSTRSWPGPVLQCGLCWRTTPAVRSHHVSSQYTLHTASFAQLSEAARPQAAALRRRKWSRHEPPRWGRHRRAAVFSLLVLPVVTSRRGGGGGRSPLPPRQPAGRVRRRCKWNRTFTPGRQLIGRRSNCA